MRALRAVILIALVACIACGEPTPDHEPSTMAGAPSDSGIAALVDVQIPGNQTFPAIDPVTGDLWFSVYEDSFDGQTIMMATKTETGWAAPEVAPFSGRWGDRAPRFSPDGSYLLITSNRPRPGTRRAGDMNIWRVERSDGSDGSEAGWGEPRFLEAPVNTPAPDFHPSITSSAIWVPSGRDGGMGLSDLYRIDTNGDVLHLGPPLNDEREQPDLWVSPDESWMILAMTDHPDGYGGDDLYVSWREGDDWATPVNLGPEINSAEYDYGPWVSPNGEDLYFTSHRGGTAHTYRVPVEIVRELVPDR